MPDSLVRQFCRVCGWTSHMNGGGYWSQWYEMAREPRARLSAQTAQYVTCPTCKAALEATATARTIGSSPPESG